MALRAGWGEDALIPKASQPVATSFAVGWSQSPSVVNREPLRSQGRRCYGKRLSGRCHFAGHIALRHWTLFHRKYRRAGVAVQYIEEAGFVALDYNRNTLSIVLDCGQQRW